MNEPLFKVGDWVALTENYMTSLHPSNVQCLMVRSGLPNRFRIKKLLFDETQKAILEEVMQYNVEHQIYTTLSEDSLFTPLKDLILLPQTHHKHKQCSNKDFRRIIPR